MSTRQEPSHSPGKRARAIRNAQHTAFLPLPVAREEAKGSPGEDGAEQDTGSPMEGCTKPRTA